MPLSARRPRISILEIIDRSTESVGRDRTLWVERYQLAPSSISNTLAFDREPGFLFSRDHHSPVALEENVKFMRNAALASVALLATPVALMAQTPIAGSNSIPWDPSRLHLHIVNFVWTLVAGFLVMFMQAGFALVRQIHARQGTRPYHDQ